MKHALKYGNTSNYFTLIILNVFMVFVMIFSMLFLGIMVDYTNETHAIFYEFNELLSLVQEIEQQSKFFIILSLHELVDKQFNVRDQVFGSLLYLI